MPRVDGRTRVYAVLGHPVAHSLSPPMHNAAFEAAGLDSILVAFDVAPALLPAVLSGLHAAGVAGLAVTLPHKESAFGLATGRTPESLRAGVANVLRWTEAGYRAHATDGAGFIAWSREIGVGLDGRRVLLLGAGGAARGVAPALLEAGASALGIVSRSEARAAELAKSLSSTGRVTAAALGDGGRASREGPWDLLVRALACESVDAPEEAWWDALRDEAPVLDLNYGVRAAGSRARAERDGRRHEDGLGLLLHQGALAFEFWTDAPAPMHAMRRALRDHGRAGAPGAGGRTGE